MKRVVILRKLRLPDRLVASHLAARVGQSSHKSSMTLIPGATLYPGEIRRIPPEVLDTLQLGVDYRHAWPMELQPRRPPPVMSAPANNSISAMERALGKRIRVSGGGISVKKVKHAGE